MKPKRPLAAVAGFAAVVVFLSSGDVLAPRHAAAVDAAPRTTVSRFSVEIDGALIPTMMLVTGLEFESEVVQYRDGADPTPRLRPGANKPGKVTLTREFTGAVDWLNWRKSVTAKLERKTVVVTLFDMSMQHPLTRVTLAGAWPDKWSGPSLDAHGSGAPTESIELVWDSIDLKK
jgi:phage tail-like protein